MARHALNGAFIDDEPEDARRYISLINGAQDELKVHQYDYRGHTDTIGHILEQRPSIIMVDFQLMKTSPRGAEPSKGSTVAAVLRERFPDTPIVLVTRGEFIESGLFDSARDVADAFDDVVLKSAISDDPQAAGRRLLAYITAFQSLAACPKDWMSLCRLLGANADEESMLRLANAPDAASKHGKSWRATEAAHWLTQVLLKFPGILLDELAAATLLGLSRDSFVGGEFQELFGEAKYKGPFEALSPRWWKGRLRKLGANFLESVGANPVRLYEFGRLWCEQKGRPPVLAKCIVSGQEPADCVCHVFEGPVRREYSLPYRPDNRPEVMDEARVSFKAIQESNKFDESLVVDDSKELIEPIQRGEEL